ATGGHEVVGHDYVGGVVIERRPVRLALATHLDVRDLLTSGCIEVDVPADAGTVRVGAGGAIGLDGEVDGLVQHLADLRPGPLQVHHRVAERQEPVGVGDGEVAWVDDISNDTRFMDVDVGDGA